jgi:molecular chaperone HtpG
LINDFKANNENEEIDIIGQFGVGFYSAFMVSDSISVISRAYGEDNAYEWKSTGVDGYTVTESEKSGVGTVITLHVKEDSETENYS